MVQCQELMDQAQAMVGDIGLMEQLVHRYMDMTQRTLTSRNQELLNTIFKELVLSLTKPLLEFVNGLLEKFMYPRGTGLKESEELGHSCIFEVVALQQWLVDLRANLQDGLKSPVKTDYIRSHLTKIQEIHTMLIHLLQRLSQSTSLPRRSYHRVIYNSINDFQRCFDLFKCLDHILRSLFEDVENCKLDDSEVFTVSDKLVTAIRQFTLENIAWFEDLMIASTALKEYLIQSKHADNVPSPVGKASSSSSSEYIIRTIYDPNFEAFVVARRAKLHITSRRVF